MSFTSPFLCLPPSLPKTLAACGALARKTRRQHVSLSFPLFCGFRPSSWRVCASLAFRAFLFLSSLFLSDTIGRSHEGASRTSSPSVRCFDFIVARAGLARLHTRPLSFPIAHAASFFTSCAARALRCLCSPANKLTRLQFSSTAGGTKGSVVRRAALLCTSLLSRLAATMAVLYLPRTAIFASRRRGIWVRLSYNEKRQ